MKYTMKYLNEKQTTWINNGRTEQNITECWDECNKKFDLDEYQYLCDCADYWDCEE